MPFSACKCVYWLMMSLVFLYMCHNPPKNEYFVCLTSWGANKEGVEAVVGLRVSEWKRNQRGEHALEHLQSSVSCAW